MPYSMLLLIGASLSAAIVLYAWRLRKTTVGPSFVGLMVCMTIYALGYAFELTCGSLSGMLFWNKIQYLGIPFIPALWIIMAARYAGRDSWITRPVLMGLFVLSAITLVANYTNSFHHLFYTHIGIDTQGLFPVIDLHWGPFYYLHIAYVNIALLTGNILLIGTYRRAAPRYRKQAAVVMAGSVLPWLGLLVYLSGLTPRGIDTTPIALTLASPFLAWGLFRYRLLDFAPVAKESVFASMEDGAIILDKENRVIDINRKGRLIFPDVTSKKFGLDIMELLPGASEIGDLLVSLDRKSVEMRIPSGRDMQIFRIRLTPIVNRKGREMAKILLLHEITEEVRMTEKLQALATTDDLTGAFNRRHFFFLGRNEIARAGRYEHPISVIIIDLDHFKRVNDTWGHEAGDNVLRAASRAFRSVLRNTDYFARYGGEEFAVILPETPIEEAKAVAERLRAKIGEQTIPVSAEERIRITASLGVAGMDRIGKMTLDGLIRAADRSLYAAKAAGRDCVCIFGENILD
jgi:diguanylate cyclase (GGDEF)-like protein